MHGAPILRLAFRRMPRQACRVQMLQTTSTGMVLRPARRGPADAVADFRFMWGRGLIPLKVGPGIAFLAHWGALPAAAPPRRRGAAGRRRRAEGQTKCSSSPSRQAVRAASSWQWASPLPEIMAQSWTCARRLRPYGGRRPRGQANAPTRRAYWRAPTSRAADSAPLLTPAPWPTSGAPISNSVCPVELSRVSGGL